MSSLVHAALTIRKTARASFGFGAALAFTGLLLLGVFLVEPRELGLEHAAVGLAWFAIFGARVARRVKERTGMTEGRWLDLELGLLLLAATHAGVQIGGGLASSVYPVIYVLIAFLSSFARPPIGTVLIFSAIGLEAALFALAEPHADWERFALHGVFILLFGALNVVFTRAEIARVRERSRKALDDDREKVRDESRFFRLAGATNSNANGDTQDKVFRSSLEQVHNALYHVLELLKATLDLNTCVLLMVDDESGQLRIVELATDSDELAEGPFDIGGGAVGAVATRGLVMRLENLKRGYKGICYYRDGSAVKSFLGVPVEDRGQVRGALCADRLSGTPFTPKDEAVLVNAVAQVLRAIENERVFVQLEKSKREQTYLHHASTKLGAALTEDEVLDAALAAASDIAPYDLAAITLYNEATRKHTVRRALGEGSEKIARLTFRDNTSLTAMAVKNQHYLPYRGEFDPKQQVVYTKRVKLTGMRSLLILPLIVGEKAIGTMAIAAKRSDAWGRAVRPTLSVLANQLAVAMSNAAAVQRLEELATTDGLTGVLNKRAFMEELERKLISAERFGRKLSLLVTDLDHFKMVNDTYGHDVGDVVIKELGAILTRLKRDTDEVARFGGEEFCVLCEETDTEGAVILAERIREVVGETVFQSDLGEFSIQASIGVATFPKDANTPGDLFKITDQALYAAKRGGRNRVCTSDDVP